MQTIKLKLTGASPLLLHSDRGSNPLHPDTIAHKVLTAARKKTDDTHIAIAKSEYLLGFYDAPNNAIAIPTQNVKSALIEAAKLNKLGMAFKRCLMIFDDWAEITHSGPKSKESLWNGGKGAYVDCRSVVVGMKRIMRYRPKLQDWSLIVDIVYHERIVEKANILCAAEDAGSFIGIGDYRPETGGNFGRFQVEEI